MTYPWLQAVEAEFMERRKAGRMAHAILLSGPGFLGKVELAKKFVGSLLCTEETYPACGVCRSCQLLSTGAHPDAQDITFEKHPKKDELRKEIIVDQIRRLISALQLSCTFSPRKSALVYPAEALTISAANALLKTLEEPPGECVLILVSHNPNRLPATIRSRCQRLDVRVPASEQALAWLRQAGDVPEAEGIAGLEAAAGSPLMALKMMREGSVEKYHQLSNMLEAVRAGHSVPGQVIGELGEIDPELLWSWLSLRAAREMRARKGALAGARCLSVLQSEADRNRGLAKTSVRKDLLLQDWLIQWSRIEG